MQLAIPKRKENDSDILAKHPNDHDRRKYLREILDYDFIYKYLHEMKLSSNKISQLLRVEGIQVDASRIINLAKEMGIESPSYAEGNRRSNLDRQKTCIKKYGARNPFCAGTKVYDQRNKTVLERYGVSNVRQADSVKETIKETNIKKYGCWASSHPEVKERVKDTLESRYGTRNFNDLPQIIEGKKAAIGLHSYRTKPHRFVESIFNANQIKTESEVSGRFKKFNKELGRVYSPEADIVLKNTKIVIEVFGDFWHATPTIYVESDIFPVGKEKLLVSDIWKRDAIKIKHYSDMGFFPFIVWEHECTKGNLGNLTQRLLKIYEDYKDK